MFLSLQAKKDLFLLLWKNNNTKGLTGNNMGNPSINYKDIIDEINYELKEGVLFPEDSIQILRSTDALMDDYFPIVDWYYDEYLMNEELNTPLEEMYMEEEFSKEEWAEMKKELAEHNAQYQADKPNLVTIKVQDALTEMKQIQKLFK